MDLLFWTPYMKLSFIESPPTFKLNLVSISSIMQQYLSFNRIMSDNVTTAKQRSCTALACEHKKYIMDMFSGMEPGHNGHNEARKQLFLYITTAEENGRKTFLQVITE